MILRHAFIFQKVPFLIFKMLAWQNFSYLGMYFREKNYNTLKVGYWRNTKIFLKHVCEKDYIFLMLKKNHDLAGWEMDGDFCIFQVVYLKAESFNSVKYGLSNIPSNIQLLTVNIYFFYKIFSLD